MATVRRGVLSVTRKALAALPELSDQFIDPCRDVVAKLANFVERALLRIGKVPIDVPLAGNERAGVITSRDDGVGPMNTFVIELRRYVVGGVDADLLEGLRSGPGFRHRQTERSANALVVNAATGR
jgi:hypothetical protein